MFWTNQFTVVTYFCKHAHDELFVWFIDVNLTVNVLPLFMWGWAAIERTQPIRRNVAPKRRPTIERLLHRK